MCGGILELIHVATIELMCGAILELIHGVQIELKFWRGQINADPIKLLKL